MLLDFVKTLPNCSGNVTIGTDEFYATAVGQPDKTGYVASVMVKGAVYTGRGLSQQEAEDNLEKKLRSKFPNV